MSHIVAVYAGNSPNLDQADTNSLRQISANVPGPTHSFTVNNSLELDSVIHPEIGWLV